MDNQELKFLKKRLKLSEARYDRLLSKNKRLNEENSLLTKKIERLEKVIMALDDNDDIKKIYKYLSIENDDLRKQIEYLKKQYNVPEDDILLL